MEDTEIINLYFNRLEDAIKETSNKYNNYCTIIARNILGNNEDVEECTNEVYMKMWNSIPPNRPNKLSAYIGKITRNTAIDYVEKYNAQSAGKNRKKYRIVALFAHAQNRGFHGFAESYATRYYGGKRYYGNGKPHCGIFYAFFLFFGAVQKAVYAHSF